MPKKTTILIIILAIITGILIFLAVRSDKSTQISRTITNDVAKPTPLPVKPYTNLAFSVQQLDLTKLPPSQSVDIILDTHGKAVSAAQVELSYDPKVFTNVSLTPAVQNQLFGKNPVVLINSVEPTQGRISFAIGISTNDGEKSGVGSIAKLSFTANKFAGIPTSQITFLPKSAVTTLGSAKSVLNSTTPLQVILLNQTNSSAIPSPAK